MPRKTKNPKKLNCNEDCRCWICTEELLKEEEEDSSQFFRFNDYYEEEEGNESDEK